MSFPEGPIRLEAVEGESGKKNDLIFQSSTSTSPSGCIVYFGGDMQDYKEKMLLHRDSKEFADWDLESTCSLLHGHFPDRAILVIKPAKMSLVTFSLFSNFANVNDFGAPTYASTDCSLKHLYGLIVNVPSALKSIHSSIVETDDFPSLSETRDSKTSERDLETLSADSLLQSVILIGFSKGCIVLNQLLYAFHHLNQTNKEHPLIQRISDVYWLDGGHSGSSSTWVVERPVLESFAKLDIGVHIHVTPFQICDERPRVGKEEKKFRDILYKLNVKMTRKFHFEFRPRSLEKHFQVLKEFRDVKTDT